MLFASRIEFRSILWLDRLMNRWEVQRRHFLEYLEQMYVANFIECYQLQTPMRKKTYNVFCFLSSLQFLIFMRILFKYKLGYYRFYLILSLIWCSKCDIVCSKIGENTRIYVASKENVSSFSHFESIEAIASPFKYLNIIIGMWITKRNHIIPYHIISFGSKPWQMKWLWIGYISRW